MEGIGAPSRSRVTVTPTCIYCKSQTNPFNREHVIPEAFGTFHPNWHLFDCVCEQCNQYFGNTIEPILTRDSPEALLRLEYGLKPPSKVQDLHYNRVTLKVNEPGVWFGARFEFVPDAIGQKIIPRPLSQVALRKKSEADFVWLLEDEITTEAVARFKGAAPGDIEIKVLSASAKDTQRLIDRLNDVGINFRKGPPIVEALAVDGSLDAAVASIMDSSIFRAISKIAFNYATYLHKPEFVLQPDFDDLRNYIRYGTTPKWAPVVRPSADSILADEPRGYQHTHGHLITFDWDRGDHGLIAQVSLFNSVNYRVRFCPRYSGCWRGDLTTGHLFDAESRTISPLRTTSLRFLAAPRIIPFQS
jgi:HNH endonuclease